MAGKATVTAGELAEILGVSLETVWRKSAPRGPIPCHRIGRAIRYNLPEVREALSQQEAPQRAKIEGLDHDWAAAKEQYPEECALIARARELILERVRAQRAGQLEMFERARGLTLRDQLRALFRA